MDNQWDVSAKIEAAVTEINNKINLGMRSRAYRASNELRNASQLVLRGSRGGRRYRVPGTKRYYTASAPGEVPAVRTGTFRASWQTKTEATGIVGGKGGFSIKASIESSTRTDGGKYLLGEILEDGTGKMAPRPYKEKIQQKALPKIKKIYSEPYL